MKSGGTSAPPSGSDVLVHPVRRADGTADVDPVDRAVVPAERCVAIPVQAGGRSAVPLDLDREMRKIVEPAISTDFFVFVSLASIRGLNRRLPTAASPVPTSGLGW